MDRTLHQVFQVDFDYPVRFTRDAFNPSNAALTELLDRRGDRRRHRVAVFIDDAVTRAWSGLTRHIESYASHHASHLRLVDPPLLLPGGERVKQDPRYARDVMEFVIAHRMDRHAVVLAIGGGAVLDAVGYSTALVHRGLRLIRMPTTVLGQNDAGVGVKNAINHGGAKNMIGTFAPPFAVLNDLDFLNTLPLQAWTDGIAEAFKVSMIKDSDFFDWLVKHARALGQRDATAMEELVVRCADLHLRHIRSSGDPFELGQARPLDFGHWSAHRLEVMTGFSISHGHAVAIGLVLDSLYAASKGWLTMDDVNVLYTALRRTGFDLMHEALLRREDDGSLAIWKGVEDFREHLGGELCITMPRGIGSSFEIHALDPALIETCVQQLQMLSVSARDPRADSDAGPVSPPVR